MHEVCHSCADHFDRLAKGRKATIFHITPCTTGVNKIKFLQPGQETEEQVNDNQPQNPCLHCTFRAIKSYTDSCQCIL